MLYVLPLALDVDSLLVYDHQTLLDLRLSAEDVVKLDDSRNFTPAPGEGPGSPVPRPGPTFSA